MNFTMKKILIWLFCVLVISYITGCSKSTKQDDLLTDQETENIFEESDAKYFLPSIIMFTVKRIDTVMEKKNYKKALELSEATEKLFGANDDLFKQREKIKMLLPESNDTEIDRLPPVNILEMEETNSSKKETENLLLFMAIDFAENRIATLIYKKEYEEALKLTYEAEDLFGVDQMLYAQRAAIYDKLAKYEWSVAEWEKCTQDFPKLGFIRLAKTYRKSGQYQEAMKTIETGLQNEVIKNDQKSFMLLFKLQIDMLEHDKKYQEVLNKCDGVLKEFSTSQKEIYAEIEKIKKNIKKKSLSFHNS